MSTAHTDRDHAALAPSAAHRWSHCPGSVPLEQQFPRSSSKAADEGTAAHELASHCLESGHDPKRYLGRVIDITGDSVATRFLAPAITQPTGDRQFLVDDEMVEGVTGYVKLVRQHSVPPNRLLVEKRLHATAVHKDCWGTGDAVVYYEQTRTLHVFDLKYGRGVVVEAEENPQLLIYAEGAKGIFGNLPIDEVAVHIYQPRAPHPVGPHRWWWLKIQDFDTRIAVLKGRADATVDASALFSTPLEDDWVEQYLSPGDHCRFCKASATCPAQMRQAMEVAKSEFGVVGEEVDFKPPHLMDSAELGRVLSFAKRIQHWINDVEEYANAEALAGRLPKGFKLVEGRRGARTWTDEAQVRAMLPVLTSIEPDAVMEPPAPPKLLSPAKLEKLLPVDQRDWLKPFVSQAPGKSTLVPADDGRAPIRADAASEFENLEV